LKSGEARITEREFRILLDAMRSSTAATVNAEQLRLVESARRTVSASTLEASVARAIEQQGNALARGIAHDHMQFLTAIYQNIDFILSTRYAGDALNAEEPEPRAIDEKTQWTLWQREKAILVACEVMKLGLRAAEIIRRQSVDIETRDRNPHHAFFKCRQLLMEKAKAGRVRVNVGSWWDPAEMNAEEEIALLPIFSFLDNAIKYAPPDSVVQIEFQRQGKHVDCGVISYGPRIEETERATIFQMGARGRHAQSSGVAGDGIGLWQAAMAARGWADLGVEQDAEPSQRYHERHRTTFTMRLLLS